MAIFFGRNQLVRTIRSMATQVPEQRRPLMAIGFMPLVPMERSSVLNAMNGQPSGVAISKTGMEP